MSVSSGFPSYGRCLAFPRRDFERNAQRKRLASVVADPAEVGKLVRIEGQQFEFTGVMPREFDYPVSAEIWRPLAPRYGEKSNRQRRFMTGLARLKTGRSLAEARAEMAGIGNRLEQAYPNENKGWGTRVMAIRERISGNLTREYMTLLMGAVGFVLLIACANVANLQLARATGRHRARAGDTKSRDTKLIRSFR